MLSSIRLATIELADAITAADPCSEMRAAVSCWAMPASVRILHACVCWNKSGFCATRSAVPRITPSRRARCPDVSWCSARTVLGMSAIRSERRAATDATTGSRRNVANPPSRCRTSSAVGPPLAASEANAAIVRGVRSSQRVCASTVAIRAPLRTSLRIWDRNAACRSLVSNSWNPPGSCTISASWSAARASSSRNINGVVERLRRETINSHPQQPRLLAAARIARIDCDVAVACPVADNADIVAERRAEELDSRIGRCIFAGAILGCPAFAGAAEFAVWVPHWAPSYAGNWVMTE